MDRDLLRDDQWDRISHLLPGKASDRGRTAADNRLFLEAVLWIMRTGAPWRDLPSRFGPWNMDSIHEAQLLSYLRLSGCHVGLLINFNVRVLKDGVKRMVHRLPER